MSPSFLVIASRRLLAPAAYFFLALIGYWPVLANSQFLSDDFDILVHIKRGEGMWNHAGEPFYRPAVSSLMSALWHLFGANPLPYHIVNLCLLVGTALCLMGIWLKLSNKREWCFTGFVIGAAFVLWPNHVEAVSWIAGNTDVLCTFFSAVSLLSYLCCWTNTIRKRKTIWGVAAFISLWLALISKEAAIAWVPIICLLPPLVFGFRWRSEWRTRIAEAAGFVAVATAYVLWRAHVLGALVGGYNGGKFRLTQGEFLDKFQINMANEFIPFDRLFALHRGFEATKFLASAAIVALAALLIRKLGGKTPISEWNQRAALVFLLALQIFLCLNGLCFTFGVLEYYGWRILLGEMVLMGLALRYSPAFRSWIRTKSYLGNNRPLFLLSSVLTLWMFSLNWVDGWVYVFAFFAVAYLTRPRHTNTSEENAFLTLGFTSLVTAMIAILPAVNLAVNLNGESGRFSYGPSFFSVLSICCVGMLYLQPYGWRAWPILGGLIGLGGFLLANNIPWAQSEACVGRFISALAKYRKDRRVYVLAEPDTVNGAYCLRVGSESVANVALDSPIQIRVAMMEKNAVWGDRAIFYRVKTTTFVGPKLKIMYERRFFLPTTVPPQVDPKNAYDFGDHLLKLKGFQPRTDHVLVVDPSSVNGFQ